MSTTSAQPGIDRQALAADIKAEAKRIGFDPVGIAPAVGRKRLLVEEKRIRMVDHPKIFYELAKGETYVNGVNVRRDESETAA